MYRAIVRTDGVDYILHDPRDDELQLLSPVVSQEVGKTGMFTFRISPLHPYKDKIFALASEVYVFDGDEVLFVGRPIEEEQDFYNVDKIKCEGELAYLVDSIQRPFEHTGSAVEFLQQMLNVHNSQVEARKQFTLGNVTVPDTVPEVTRSSTEGKTTLETIKACLTEINGGYLVVRRSGGVKYLDYVHDYGGINSQIIRFGENILDMKKYVDPTKIYTALIPYGGTVESANPEEKEQRVDITSVNAGRDYIFNQDAVNTYGWIWTSQTFEDVTDPETLLMKATAYLNESIYMPETLEVRALDLSLTDVNINKLRLGYWTTIISKPHKISHRFLLSKKETHLDDPAKDVITLGRVLSTFTGNVNKREMQVAGKIDRVASSSSREINRKVENATQLITGGKGGYVVLDVEDPDSGEKRQPWRILIMDTPDKETATSVIQLNKNGIGFSTSGINGPYANAWTIDGNLVADFITTGTMLADRIRGGTMELGGSGIARDGKITVKDINDNVIGYWDKTGLNIFKGVLNGPDIIGGTIDIGHGTFEVNADGEVTIASGTINIGNTYISPGYTWLGDFGISSTGAGVFYSRNGEVEISTSNYDSGGPAVVLKKGNVRTRIGFGGIDTGDIALSALKNRWGAEWESVADNIIELWERIERLESRI